MFYAGRTVCFVSSVFYHCRKTLPVLLILPFLPSFCEAQGPIANGANVTGSINRNQSVTWTFSSSTGHAIIVSISEQGSQDAFQPHIQIVGPGGVFGPPPSLIETSRYRRQGCTRKVSR